MLGTAFTIVIPGRRPRVSVAPDTTAMPPGCVRSGDLSRHLGPVRYRMLDADVRWLIDRAQSNARRGAVRSPQNQPCRRIRAPMD
jgi:hypothetical protein